MYKYKDWKVFIKIGIVSEMKRILESVYMVLIIWLIVVLGIMLLNFIVVMVIMLNYYVFGMLGKFLLFFIKYKKFENSSIFINRNRSIVIRFLCLSWIE